MLEIGLEINTSAETDILVKFPVKQLPEGVL